MNRGNLNIFLQAFTLLCGTLTSGVEFPFARTRGRYYVSTPASPVRVGEKVTVGFLAGHGHTVADYIAAYETGRNKFCQAVETEGRPQGDVTFQFITPGKYFFKYLASPCEEKARSNQIQVRP
jgi:hypothetical protein